MWYSDTIAQETVWTDEFMLPTEFASDFDHEDEEYWSDADYEDEWERMAEDAAMEGHLFGWDA